MSLTWLTRHSDYSKKIMCIYRLNGVEKSMKNRVGGKNKKMYLERDKSFSVKWRSGGEGFVGEIHVAIICYGNGNGKGGEPVIL